MNADEIRALYVETLARAEFRRIQKRKSWDKQPEFLKAACRRGVAHLADALSEVGALAVGVEYGNSLGGDSVMFGCAAETARKMANPVRRFVGGWIPMEGDGLW